MNKIVTKLDLHNILLENNRPEDASDEDNAFYDFAFNRCLTYDNIINHSKFFEINEILDRNRLIAKKYLKLLETEHKIKYNNYPFWPFKFKAHGDVYSDVVKAKSFRFSLTTANIDKNKVRKLYKLPNSFKTNIYYFLVDGYVDELTGIEYHRGIGDIIGLSLTLVDSREDNGSLIGKFEIGEFDNTIPIEYDNEHCLIKSKQTMSLLQHLIGDHIEFYLTNNIYNNSLKFDIDKSQDTDYITLEGNSLKFGYNHDPYIKYYDIVEEPMYNGIRYDDILVNSYITMDLIEKYDYDNIIYNFRKDVIYDVYDMDDTLLASFSNDDSYESVTCCYFPLQDVPKYESINYRINIRLPEWYNGIIDTDLIGTLVIYANETGEYGDEYMDFYGIDADYIRFGPYNRKLNDEESYSIYQTFNLPAEYQYPPTSITINNFPIDKRYEFSKELEIVAKIGTTPEMDHTATFNFNLNMDDEG